MKRYVAGKDDCLSTPCQNEGVCTDVHGDVKCQCVAPYGGTKCNLSKKSSLFSSSLPHFHGQIT